MFPVNVIFPVIMIKISSPAKAPIELMLELIELKSFHEGFGPAIYIFFLMCQSLYGSNMGSARIRRGAHSTETCGVTYEQPGRALDFWQHHVYITAAIADT